MLKKNLNFFFIKRKLCWVTNSILTSFFSPEPYSFVFLSSSSLRIQLPIKFSPHLSFFFFHCFLVYLQWSDGPRCHHLLFFSFFFFLFVVNFVIHWNETAMGLHVFPIPIPPPTSLSTRSLWVFPVHQVRALVSCIQPGLVICFTLDNIHVSMLFSWNIPPSPSPTESKRLFYKSVSLFLFCI